LRRTQREARADKILRRKDTAHVNHEAVQEVQVRTGGKRVTGPEAGPSDEGKREFKTDEPTTHERSNAALATCKRSRYLLKTHFIHSALFIFFTFIIHLLFTLVICLHFK
jgi:hypothetical protein